MHLDPAFCMVLTHQIGAGSNAMSLGCISIPFGFPLTGSYCFMAIGAYLCTLAAHFPSQMTRSGVEILTRPGFETQFMTDSSQALITCSPAAR